MDITQSHLDLALEIFANFTTKDFKENKALDKIAKSSYVAILTYILDEFIQINGTKSGISEEYFDKRFSELVSQKIIDNMVLEGYIEEDFNEGGEHIIKVTQLGKRMVEDLC